MTTVLQTPKIRKRRVPQPVHGSARWIGGTPTREQLNEGEARLQITAEGKEPQIYFVEVLRDGPKLTGYSLIKFDSLDKTATYDIDATFSPDPRHWCCDCPDATYTDRPGGCKHLCGLVAALRAAGLLQGSTAQVAAA
jgi:hypothetical protein